MKWKKKGLIFCADGISDQMISHARIPVANHFQDDEFEIYFASRDNSQRERIFKLRYDILKNKVLEVKVDPLLDYGDTLGAFDDNGICPCSIIDFKGEKRLYYAGWQKQVNTPFSCAVGLAVSKDNGKSFEKKYKGPVLDRDMNDFLFVAVNHVIYDEGVFKTWYLSCIDWKKTNTDIVHYYHINYAESLDGVKWNIKKGTNAITFKNQHEYAISTPRVIKDGPEDYKIWYSYRAQEDIETYRIGYAESKDGINWERMDEKMSSLDISQEGWDSEMICYPYVFDHKGERYMLYNGNGYGHTGFGLAKLEK
jgi:hypothetical protein